MHNFGSVGVAPPDGKAEGRLIFSSNKLLFQEFDGTETVRGIVRGNGGDRTTTHSHPWQHPCLIAVRSVGIAFYDF